MSGNLETSPLGPSSISIAESNALLARALEHALIPCQNLSFHGGHDSLGWSMALSEALSIHIRNMRD